MLGDEEDEALLRALLPSEQERALLECVQGEALRDKLLLLLLRAPVGESVDVLVNTRMRESDSFSGASLPELVATGRYVPGSIVRSESKDHGQMCFALKCADNPQLQRSYDGDDDVTDFLLQYFAKELIVFPQSEVSCDILPPSWQRQP